MRWRALVVVMAVLLGGCRAGGAGSPPVVRASEPVASETASEDAREARLVALRATDHFDEFAAHERAAQADGARLAWENFAPIVDGERVEWTNKAELWDEIAPKIRDEALLLGPEYREPLWDNTNAIPNGVSMAWNNEDTQGRGDYVEFGATLLSGPEPSERYWGVLIRTDGEGRGVIVGHMPPLELKPSDFPDHAKAQEHLADQEWAWVVTQPKAESS
jgi:hypothetical protein